MLLNLHVKNLAIIDEIDVYFNNNLNIITGETGSGKSIIIGSINIALGAKVTKDIIRKGKDFALVELLFQIENEVQLKAIEALNISIDDNQLIISRKILNGKSINKVNGEIVTTSVLKSIAGIVIDIHGQHEHQTLIDKNKNLELLDRFAKDSINDLKAQVECCYEEYYELKKKLEDMLIDEDKRLREISFLEYEINEINEADLKLGEDEELSIRYKKLLNSNVIVDNISQIYAITGEGNKTVSDLISHSIKMLSKVEDYDEKINDFESQLLDVEGLINDFNREINAYIDELDYSQDEFEKVEKRLDNINNLKAKYGKTIKEILQYRQKIIEKYEQYKNYDQYILDIKSNLKTSENHLKQLCLKLSNIRKNSAEILVIKMKQALQDLNFLDVKFDIHFEKLDKYTKNGYDEIEFLISTNIGEDMKPLAKVASGGELSRIMLAIKSVLADNDLIDTLIFDEIDVGVSGRTAQKVSEKLSFISKNHQVICITHLSQIAAMADTHYIIEKSSNENKTTTSIKQLNEQESIKELARILGGAKITQNVINSAKEMKMLAKNSKNF